MLTVIVVLSCALIVPRLILLGENVIVGVSALIVTLAVVGEFRSDVKLIVCVPVEKFHAIGVVICVADTIVKFTAVPPIVIVVTCVKFVPVSVSVFPATIGFGLTAVIVIGATNVKPA